MIIGTHTVISSKDPAADREFFSDILGLSSVAAGGGYVIFKLPPGEASVHESEADEPRHELYFLTDDVAAFVSDMQDRGVACGDVLDTGWGQLVKITLPSGAPINVYQPRHERPE